ncbi:hypothetical protein HNP11_002417 [Tsukamurella ocularis]|nr:hypothetical protein [Tsukamurella ocularis]MCS3788232.1 hypothetical protein [Tsukamurella ocularis]MCS3851952.1 hypothetical protein [Tsukamurella ocularis]
MGAQLSVEFAPHTEVAVRVSNSALNSDPFIPVVLAAL